MLADSLYPSGQKKLQKLHADIDAGNTFAAVADEWRAMHLVENQTAIFYSLMLVASVRVMAHDPNLRRRLHRNQRGLG